ELTHHPGGPDPGVRRTLRQLQLLRAVLDERWITQRHKEFSRIYLGQGCDQNRRRRALTSNEDPHFRQELFIAQEAERFDCKLHRLSSCMGNCLLCANSAQAELSPSACKRGRPDRLECSETRAIARWNLPGTGGPNLDTEHPRIGTDNHG